MTIFSPAHGRSFANPVQPRRSCFFTSPRSTNGSSTPSAPSSMHVFCMKELGFSEGAAYNRIGVARAAGGITAILDALPAGAVYPAGLRVLVPHLDQENHERLLGKAAGKSKREIEEMPSRLSPK